MNDKDQILEEEIEDEEFDLENPEEELEDEEETTTEDTSAEPGKEELSPFAKVIKAYLEEESEKDPNLKKAFVNTTEAINMCDRWITDYVRNLFKGKSRGYGFLSDAEGYQKMREFFLDGFYEKMLEEEKQKKLKAEKEKEEQKKKAEEKKEKDEEKKKWEEYCKNPMSSTLSDKEKDILTLKYAEQQSLF